MAEKETGHVEGKVAESGRDRVRRLLIHKLQEHGFRFRRGTAEDGRKMLDRLADDLAYMTDAGLSALQVSLRTKGEGAARCFWPAPATVLGLAEDFERRPLIELPALLRWFRSEAGRAALAHDRLVAEYWFWTDRKRPPVKPADRKTVADRAAGYARRVELAEDRLAREVPLADQERRFLDWYRARLAYVSSLVADQRDGEAA